MYICAFIHICMYVNVYGYLVEMDVEVLHAMALPLGIYTRIYVCLYIYMYVCIRKCI
jgi:hypothetical protein